MNMRKKAVRERMVLVLKARYGSQPVHGSSLVDGLFLSFTKTNTSIRELMDACHRICMTPRPLEKL